MQHFLLQAMDDYASFFHRSSTGFHFGVEYYIYFIILILYGVWRFQNVIHICGKYNLKVEKIIKAHYCNNMYIHR